MKHIPIRKGIKALMRATAPHHRPLVINTKCIALLLSIALLAIGCSKEKFDGPPQGMLERYSYKPGSYWIFRDSLSGRMDSLYVESNTYLNTHPGYEPVSNNIKLKQVNIEGGQQSDSCTWGITLLRLSSSRGVINGGFSRFKYIEGLSGYWVDYPFVTRDIASSIANYKIGAYSFPSVFKIRLDRIKDDSNYHKVFIAEYDGFVRIEFCSVTRIDASAVFILQRYKVVK